MAANVTGNTAGFAWGFTWYYAIFPQMEQQQIFNAVNFSLSPADPSQYLGGHHQGQLHCSALRNPPLSSSIASTNLYTLASDTYYLRR